MIYTIQNEFLNIEIDDIGAHLKSAKDKNGLEFIWQRDERYWKDSSPILFPYIARLWQNKYTFNSKTYNMDIHGFAKDSLFKVVELKESEITFLLKDTKETFKQYPFNFEFFITFKLEKNSLITTFKVNNKSKYDMYFAIGAHPGFNVPIDENLQFNDYYLEFLKNTKAIKVGMSDDCFVNLEDEEFNLLKDDKLFLEHSLFDDDAIILKNMNDTVTLKSNKSKKSISLNFKDMPYLGLWHKPKTKANYICIEPWTSLPARKGVVEDLTLQENLIKLNEGKAYTNTYTITFTS